MSVLVSIGPAGFWLLRRRPSLWRRLPLWLSCRVPPVGGLLPRLPLLVRLCTGVEVALEVSPSGGWFLGLLARPRLVLRRLLLLRSGPAVGRRRTAVPGPLLRPRLALLAAVRPHLLRGRQSEGARSHFLAVAARPLLREGETPLLLLGARPLLRAVEARLLPQRVVVEARPLLRVADARPLLRVAALRLPEGAAEEVAVVGDLGC